MDQGNDWPIMLTAKQAAHILHLHLNTVRQWESCGVLRGYRIGPRHDRRFEQDEILHLLRTIGNENNGKQQ